MGRIGALSSAVEQLVYTEWVGGPTPSARTLNLAHTLLARDKNNSLKGYGLGF